MRTLAIIVTLALAACGSKKDNNAPPATGSGSAVVTAPADAGSGSGSAVAEQAVDVPTEVDFEDSASAEITDKNLEARVKALETELTQ